MCWALREQKHRLFKPKKQGVLWLNELFWKKKKAPEFLREPVFFCSIHTLFIRQVAVLGGDARGIVLQFGAEPLVTEVATIET